MSANLMELTRSTSPGSPAAPNGVTVGAAVSPAAPQVLDAAAAAAASRLTPAPTTAAMATHLRRVLGVHELRQPNDINDKDQRKGDLTIEGLFREGKTILDVGITHPTIDTYINTQSSEAPRGSAANKMAANKNRRAHNIIEEKGLDIDFKAITFTTFGGFGEGTHELIKEVTKDTDWSLNDPWVKPNPKSHAYLTFGFALARANARMLLHADSRRRSAKNRVRTTRPQSATS